MASNRHLIESTGTPRRWIDVETTEYERMVLLSIELDESEFVGRIPEFPASKFRTNKDEIEARISYERLLLALLQGVKNGGHLLRELGPDEARAIAASLVHYAAEAEAGR